MSGYCDVYGPPNRCTGIDDLRDFVPPRRPRSRRADMSSGLGCLHDQTTPAPVGCHSLVGSGTGAVVRRQPLVCVRGFPLRARVEAAVIPFPVPAASHAACGFTALRAPAPLRDKGYGAISSMSGRPVIGQYATRYAWNSPSVPYSQSRLHRFHPKPCRWLARARWCRIFFSTQSRMYEKHRLE